MALYPLLVSAAVAAAVLPPAALGPGRPTNPMLFGVNECWTAFSGSDLCEPTRLRAMRQMGIRAVRWPGGTLAELVNLTSGRDMPLDRIQRVFGNNSGPYLGAKKRRAANSSEPRLANATRFVAAANATPIWSLNIATQGAADVLASVDAIAAAGADGRYVELGNELYLGYYANCSVSYTGCNASGSAFPRGSLDYIERVAPTVAALRLQGRAFSPPAYGNLDSILDRR